jgi:hypothetical protein
MCIFSKKWKAFRLSDGLLSKISEAGISDAELIKRDG